MDAVIETADLTTKTPVAPQPAMPEERPLAMPTQSFERWSAKEKRTLTLVGA